MKPGTLCQSPSLWTFWIVREQMQRAGPEQRERQPGDPRRRDARADQHVAVAVPASRPAPPLAIANSSSSLAVSLIAAAATIIAPPSPHPVASIRYTPAMTISIISRSLWPPPTPKITISGLRPTSATAFTGSIPRSRAAFHTSATVPRLASAAIAL